VKRILLLLLVIVVSAGLLGAAILVPPLIDDSSRKSPIEIAHGHSISASGYTWKVSKSAEFTGKGTGKGGNSVPKGLSLVAALVDIHANKGADKDLTCNVALTSRSTGTERSWPQIGNPRDFSYGVGEDTKQYCVLSGKSVQLEVVFLTPAKTGAHATLDLEFGGQTRRFVLRPEVR
jgi:hypothetical protein